MKKLKKITLPMIVAMIALVMTTLSRPVQAEIPTSATTCAIALHDPVDAMTARRRLIRAAESEIILSYFYFTEDEWTDELFALLTEARARGVTVKILLDAWQTKLSRSFIRFLVERDIQVKLYNSPRKLRNIVNFTHRNHDKYLIVDKNLILVGGRNLDAGYFLRRGDIHKSFYDMDTLFRGKSAVEAETYFHSRWESKWVSIPLVRRLNEKELLKVEQKIAAAQLMLDAQYPDPRKILSLKKTVQQSEVAAQLKDELIQNECSDSNFISPKDTKKLTNHTMEESYVKLINESSESIDIVNPYVILTRKIKNALHEALYRSVKVRIFTNSLQTNDNALAQAAYLNDRPELLAMGIELHEFFDDIWTLHSKVAVFDNKKILIGSFNLDPRSAKLNSEAFIISTDLIAVQAIQSHVEATVKYSKLIMSDGRPLGSDVMHPNASKARLKKLDFLQLIARVMRSQL